MTKRKRHNSSLDGVYTPAAKGIETLDTLIPDSMDEGMRTALERLNNALGGDVAGFVCARLKITREQLAQYFKAEQVDSIALAIYNIEARHEAMVCGDETGVGKGRQAAGIVRYAKENGRLPIFFTEKKNLFSDFYRDAKDTGIAHYKPLIINSDGTVYDYDKCIDPTPGAEKYEAVYEPLPNAEMAKIFKSKKMPEGYDYILCTYSQLSDSEEKKEFLASVAERGKAIYVCDEAHNAAGQSSRGDVVRELISAEGCDVIFLSATFAKAPKNLLLYIQRTKLKDCTTPLTLSLAISRGGIPLQELISSLLVESGQMVRRQRDNTKIEVNYNNTDEADRQIDDVNYNRIMRFVRDALSLQNMHVMVKLGKQETPTPVVYTPQGISSTHDSNRMANPLPNEESATTEDSTSISELEKAIAYLDGKEDGLTEHDKNTWDKTKMENYEELKGLYDDLVNLDLNVIVSKWGEKLSNSSRFKDNVVNPAKKALGNNYTVKSNKYDFLKNDGIHIDSYKKWLQKDHKKNLNNSGGHSGNNGAQSGQQGGDDGESQAAQKY